MTVCPLFLDPIPQQQIYFNLNFKSIRSSEGKILAI